MKSYNAFAQFYDLLTQDVDYANRAAYFHSLIDRYGNGGNLLLDLACGTGSLSLYLEKLGYNVIGVDGSPAMLGMAVSKKTADSEILYLCQEMDRLDLYGSIDVAVCALDSLNHVMDMSQLRDVFKRVSLFLNPGGVFIFDVNTEYKHKEILGNNTFIYDLDEVYCVWQNIYDAAEMTTTIELDFFQPDDEGAYWRSAESFQERVYTHEQLSALAQETDFEIAAVYDGDEVDGFIKESDTNLNSNPNPNPQRLIYVLVNHKGGQKTWQP